jgi:hypothetical protein
MDEEVSASTEPMSPAKRFKKRVSPLAFLRYSDMNYRFECQLTQKWPHPQYKHNWSPPVEAMKVPVYGRGISYIEVLQLEFATTNNMIISK